MFSAQPIFKHYVTFENKLKQNIACFKISMLLVVSCVICYEDIDFTSIN
jgi:hypothetical protein